MRKKLSLTGSLNALYDEAALPRDIRKTLNFIMLGNLCGGLMGIVCGGGTTAMVGLAGTMGATDLIFGILVAIPQVVNLLQIPFSAIVNRTHKRKKYLLTIGLGSRVLWIFMGLIPLLSHRLPSEGQLLLLILLMLISNSGGAMINVCWFPWFSDVSPIGIRGRWLSFRERISAILNLLAGLGIGFLLDHLPMSVRYPIVFGIGGTFGVIDMVCFGFGKEVYSAAATTVPLRSTLKEALHNKPFVRFTVMWTLYNFTSNLAGAYLTPYAINEMGLTFMQMMLFGTIAAAVATILAVPYWGRSLDRFGCNSVMYVTCIGVALTQLFYLFSTPGNVIPTLLYNITGAFFWSGSGMAANNMQLICSPDETRPTYLAIFSCVTATLGVTLGSFLGGIMLETWNARGMFTGWFDRYKMLILIGSALRLAAMILAVPKLENDRDATAGDMMRDLFHKKRG